MMRASRAPLSTDQELVLGRFVAVTLDVQAVVPRRHRASIDGLPEAIDAAMRVGTALGWSDRSGKGGSKPQRTRGKRGLPR
jgi:hypothetical protein